MCRVRVQPILKYGATTSAGANRALKVGKAGAKCSARFQSQHYDENATSTLALTLLKTTVLWPYLGVVSLDELNVRAWIEQNTHRHNFLLAAEDEPILGKLETYLKAGSAPFSKAAPNSLEHPRLPPLLINFGISNNLSQSRIKPRILW